MLQLRIHSLIFKNNSTKCFTISINESDEAISWSSLVDKTESFLDSFQKLVE